MEAIERVTERKGAVLSPVGMEAERDRRSSGTSSNTGNPAGGGRAPVDPEVTAERPRRRLTAQYKLRILEEADRCRESGGIGALLRREGLYSSSLRRWRRQRDEGVLQGLAARKRGRKPQERNPLAARVAELEKENERLRKRLGQAETIIEVQKKISEILGISLDRTGSAESKS